VWHSPFKLYLYPANQLNVANIHQILVLLKKLHFIDQKISDTRYSTGDGFLSLITFMGCSPDIELDPHENVPYCYIEIESSEALRFISGINTKPAPCPKCKQGITNVPDPANSKLRCPGCNEKVKTSELNWRKSAFLAKSWIRIGNIYELEAVPNDQLLNALKSETGEKWKYAYIREVSR